MPRQQFSDRHGFTKPRDVFQMDFIDEDLRNRLWNIVKNDFIDVLIADNYDSESFRLKETVDKLFIVRVYDAFFKEHLDPLEFSKKTDKI
jgi:23S rRNA U2552 (ribose-2'-O)-methylase RlmE/FtsJ